MTNPHCECPVSGWCKRHQMMKGAERHKRCQGTGGTRDCGLSYWNAWEQGRLGATAPEVPVINPDGFCGKPAKVVSQIGTKLSEIIKRETGIEVPCAVCRERIATLDTMTAEQARSVKASIVADIVARAPENAQTLWQRIAITADSVLHTGILSGKVSAWFDEAVATGWQPIKKKVLQSVKPRAKVAAGGRGKNFLRSLKAEQDRLYVVNQLAKPPEPDPFIGEPVLHFGAHVYPVAGNWEWHVDLWNQMPRLINGRCFVGVAADHHTVSADEVRKRLRPEFEVYEFANTVEGENHTFRWLQEVTPQGPDDVLIYCHGKGVRNHTAQSEAVRRWSDAMYQTVVFNHDMIREKLAAGYRNVHSFRTFGTRPLSPAHKWHPSGTFFAVRAKYLPNREVKPRYGGVEAWCGDHFKASESWCEFYDNSMFTTLYDHRESRELVLPMLTEWDRKQRYEVDDMCSTWGRNFAKQLPEGSIRGKQVIEIGARDVNGSCRPWIIQQLPASYLGVDMDAGQNVDIVCTGQELPDRVGRDAAEVLICTEVLEHVADWHGFLTSIWSVLRPGGILLLTTRSPGFPYHEYPSDHWRFTVPDMLAIFSGQEILTITSDPTSDPGVGVIIRKSTDVLQSCNPHAM